MIVNTFKNGTFPFVFSDYTSDDDRDLQPDSPTSSFSTTDKSDKSNEFDFTADDLDKIYIGNADDLDELLLDTDKYLDPDLIEKYFFNKSLKKLFEFLKHKKGALYKKTKITLIKSRLRDLKNDIKNMSENEVKSRNLDLLAGLVEKILDTNKPLNMPELETEESAEKRRNQQGQGSKILTPQQMLCRLPISLAQLKAENNSRKL